jgi:hypothetical protein
MPEKVGLGRYRLTAADREGLLRAAAELAKSPADAWEEQHRAAVGYAYGYMWPLVSALWERVQELEADLARRQP